MSLPTPPTKPVEPIRGSEKHSGISLAGSSSLILSPDYSSVPSAEIAAGGTSYDMPAVEEGYLRLILFCHAEDTAAAAAAEICVVRNGIEMSLARSANIGGGVDATELAHPVCLKAHDVLRLKAGTVLSGGIIYIDYRM